MTGFLFGKLPAFGDFVSRGLSARMRGWWDCWCTTALVDARCSFEESFEQRYQATGPHRFLIAPTESGCWQAGCVVASGDRAGRAFPFVLGVTSSLPIEAMAGAAMAERIAGCLDAAFARRVDLDALAAAAADAAADLSRASRPVPPTGPGCQGWIGENPHNVEL